MRSSTAFSPPTVAGSVSELRFCLLGAGPGDPLAIPTGLAPLPFDQAFTVPGCDAVGAAARTSVLEVV